ncbi:hypothetical protein [Amycolatopsis jiangsuensis]|uniref:Uncharacterized protein n=1 Tax=Amycolatopsis jiangsuensis TaxID=1181879 RepID=A0A840J3Z0_9PSEU|nr:hypothetical protein [Amycolatopsis jiangsuensis]MBB4689806.1 hypothetical protein [Amycolatopsis jiangsuensis]
MKVYFSQGFSQVVDVAAESVGEAIEKASVEVYFGLCHECGHKMSEDGEAEALYVFDDNNNELWRHPSVGGEA